MNDAINQISGATSEPSSTRTYRAVANKCSTGACPTVYAAGAESSVVVQGFVVPASQVGIDLPDGEMLVEVPLELLAEAVRNLS